MGVQGLWELLAPVGRRVSVEALSGRKLAIDASIWIIQFMKAMRDDKGDMIRNAHLLGFFRRICKLLYLRAKPLFVFDGGTPALKRRTVIARRRQRERAQSKIRKTAEKLLLNHLRTRKLDEIAQNIGLGHSMAEPEKPNREMKQPTEEQEKANVGSVQHIKRQWQPGRSTEKGKFESQIEGSIMDQLPLAPQESSMLHEDGKFAASIATEHATSDNDNIENESDNTDDDDGEYFLLPPTQGRVDPAVLASLPPSMQLNLLVQMREQLVTDNRKRFQKVAKNPASFSQMQIQAYLKTVAFRRDINQVQKAAAGKGIGGIPSARIASEVDREYVFSTNFQPEKKETELQNRDVHQEPRSQLHERMPDTEIIQCTNMITEREELTPAKTLDTNRSEDDEDIEWEDVTKSELPVPRQPVKGAVITIEVDQADLFAEGSAAVKLHPDVMSESEEIEWEDDASAVESINNNDLKDAAVTLDECGAGTNLFTSKGLDSPEEVNRTLMEIEAAELEEAIHQSLQDHKALKERKPIIRDEATATRNECDMPRHGNVLIESSLSEEAYLARERERKGKAIVDDLQAVFLENGNVDNKKISSVEWPGLKQIDFNEIDQLKPVSNEENVAFPVETHRFGTDGYRVQEHPKSPVTSCSSVIPKIDVATPFKNVSCKEEFIALSQSANGLSTKTDSFRNLESSCFAEAAIKTENSGNETIICQPLLISEKGGEMRNLENKKQANYESQEIVDTLGIAETSTDAVLDHEEVVHSLAGHAYQAVDEQLQDALLKEAEEINLTAEREAFSKKERDIIAEREDLAHQQAELQAEMIAEQAAMQATLQEERDFLLQEEMELRASQHKNERNAESVSGEMFSECQELLQMFGLPYIIAPMEAEAQCAHMDSIGLVDGVVTDDCDVFLFGGRNVFKNIFDDRKYVETYYMKDIESELGLDQEKLIHMALLLGSDYTEGISGIGIVNAIEVVNAFEGEPGLQKFKEWLDAPDMTLLKKIHQDGEKKQIKKKKVDKEIDADVSHVVEEENDDTSKGDSKYNPRQQGFMDKHRAVSKNWNAPESFPNPMVINAYRSPQVDKSSEAFTWGRPDLEALRGLCLEQFGWNKGKSDELLVPVLKEYDRHETQLRLEAFYSFNQRFAKIRSKRIQKAVTRGTGRLSSELVDFPTAADQSENLSPPDGQTNDSNLQSEHVKKTKLPTKTSTKKIAASKKRKETATRGGRVDAVRGKGRVVRGRPKTLKKADSPSDRASSEDMSDLDPKKCMDGINALPRRSHRLPQRAIYNFSGSEEDVAKSPLHDANVLSPDVKYVDEHSIFSNSKVLGAETNGNGDETTVTVANSQCGSQSNVSLLGGGFCAPDVGNGSMQEESCHPARSHDDSYLVIGGGFCVADADDEGAQKVLDEATELQNVNKCAALNNDLNITSKETLCSGTSLVGSTSLNTETARQQPTLPEPSLRAVPSLRRKKRRMS